MYGHQLINHDTKKISYDLPVKAPFIGEVILNKQALEKSLEFIKDKGIDSIRTSTAELDGIRIRELSFEELQNVIDRMELVVTDLKEIKSQIENK